jgi:hypothetical protein
VTTAVALMNYEKLTTSQIFFRTGIFPGPSKNKSSKPEMAQRGCTLHAILLGTCN